MSTDFPVEVDKIEYSPEELGPLANPRYLRAHIQINDDDFLLKIKNIASYRVQGGKYIYYHPYVDADEPSVNLFLNGSVFGAVLHQRKLLPFHGSSFLYEGKGVIICGNSGTGKSSAVAAFCQNGAIFINDDITPVKVENGKGFIIPVKTRIKLWNDSIKKLNIENNGLERIRAPLDKFYIPGHTSCSANQILNHVFLLQIHNNDSFLVSEVEGLAKFQALRSMIYRKSYLKGMPETEAQYFTQIIKLSGHVRITSITRPQTCSISSLMDCIRTVLNGQT